jgi:hypothetical protein
MLKQEAQNQKGAAEKQGKGCGIIAAGGNKGHRGA